MLMYYKSLRSIAGKLKWILMDEEYNIIQSPTKEHIKLAIIGDPPKKCCICRGIDTYINNSGTHVWHGHVCDKKNCTKYICQICQNIDNRIDESEIEEYILNKRKGRKCYICNKDLSGDDYGRRYYNEKGDWTGEYVCHKHHYKYGYHGQGNLKKLLALCRNRDFDIKRKKCKGCIGAQIIGETICVRNLNIETDNFNYYVDLSKHVYYGYSEVKTATLIYGRWDFSNFNEKDFDTLFLVCMDQYELWKDVKRVYAIPWEDAIKRSTITIYENPSRISWYRDFEIDVKPFNDTYHKMDVTTCMLNRPYDDNKKDI